jgi:hypothetical protein
VSKTPKADSERSNTGAPTFEARFADGTITRMTTHCENGKLDLGRGVRLARVAYRGRKGKEPPPIEAGRFVERNDDGADTVLKTYTRDELNAVPAAREND